MSISIGPELLSQYARYSLYNSPYPSHDTGKAIDLYPGHSTAYSPVSGTVIECVTVGCPKTSYASPEDHLILVDCDSYIARILHVEPWVDEDEVIQIGDPLGKLIRSGYFARWVDPHIHLEFRPPGQNPIRAAGSVPIEISQSPAPISWDGIGSIIEQGTTFIRLDAPVSPDSTPAALSTDQGYPLDGGVPHYDGGGILDTTASDGCISILGTPIGTVTNQRVEWDSLVILINDRPATGLSLFVSNKSFGIKIVFADGHPFRLGETVQVTIEAANE